MEEPLVAEGARICMLLEADGAETAGKHALIAGAAELLMGSDEASDKPRMLSILKLLNPLWPAAEEAVSFLPSI